MPQRIISLTKVFGFDFQYAHNMVLSMVLDMCPLFQYLCPWNSRKNYWVPNVGNWLDHIYPSIYISTPVTPTGRKKGLSAINITILAYFCRFFYLHYSFHTRLIKVIIKLLYIWVFFKRKKYSSVTTRWRTNLWYIEEIVW